MAENFLIELIASLKRNQSKKKIQEDAKNLGEIKVPLIGTLNKTRTRTQLKRDLESLNGTVNLKGKVDKKGIVTSVQQATQQAQKQANTQPIRMEFSIRKDKLINDIKLLGQQNSKLFKDVDMTQKYNQLLDSVKLASNTKDLQNLRFQLGAFRSELKVTGNSGMTLLDALKNGLRKTLQLFGSYGIIMQFTTQLRNAWKEARELDSSLTELSRVNAEISRSDFPDYLDKVIAKTKQLGVAVKDYIDAVTTFSRAGYNLADSETLSSMAVQLEKVGDMSAKSASKALLSGLQGYEKIDGYGMDQLAEKAQALNDKIDLIGNTASITQEEVAGGIQAVGSVMSDANTSVDEFIALLGAGNRAVQDANKVALAIRTSSLRIRSCTAELEEMGETTDDVIKSTSTLAAKIKALTNVDGSGGVNILEADEKTFRPIYDIYNDIAKVYSQMSDTDATALLDLIAGKNRSNQVSAILNNMSEANELLNSSLNATGTASAEYEIYVGSAEAAIERFGVAMTETYSNILNGETVKSLTNAGTAVLDFANSFGILEGAFRGFLTLGILKGITALSVAFKNSAVQVSNFGNALNCVKDLGSLTRGTHEYTDAVLSLKQSCVGLTDAQLKQVLANDSLSESQRLQILMYQGLTMEQAKEKLTQLGLTDAIIAQNTANKAATASTFSFSTAVKGLGTSLKMAFMSNPIGVTIMGISTAISLVTMGINKFKQANEELRQSTEEAANAYKETSSSISDYVSKYKELKQALEAAKGNEEETYNVKKQLLELQTELNDKYGDEYGKINLVTDAYKDMTGAIQDYNKEAAKTFLNENHAGIEDAEDAMTKKRHYNLSPTEVVSGSKEGNAIRELVKKYAAQGMSVLESVDGTTFSVHLNATADSAYDTINAFENDLRAKAEELGNEDLFDDVLSISSDALNDAKDVIGKYGEIYKQSLLADIAGNDNKAEKFNELISAVEEYNEALLKSEDPYNDEEVAEARENIRLLQQELSGEDWKKYGAVILEVLNQADTRLLDFYNDLRNGIPENGTLLEKTFGKIGRDNLRKQAEGLKGLTRVDLESMVNDGDNGDVFDEYRKSAESYGLSVEELIDMLIRLGIIQDDISNSDIETPKTLKETLGSAKDKIDDYQSSIKSLSDSMKDVSALSASDIVDLMQEHPDFDWEKYGVTGAAGVGELDDALKALTEQQMKEIDSALESAGASDEMREAFASMAREAVADADRMGAVTTKLKDISSAYKTVQTALQEYAETGYMSVENATAMLNLDDAYLAALVNEQGQITLQADAYRQLMYARLDEAEAKATQQAIADLESITSESTALAYLTQNNYAVSSSLYEKANAYAQVEAAAKKALAAEGAGQYTTQAVNGIMNAYKARMSIIQATRNSVARSVPKTLGGSSGSGSGSGGSSSSSKPSSKEIDWFEYRIKELDEAIELAQTHLDNLTGSDAKNHLVDTMESLYSTKQHDLKQGLDMYSKMAQAELAKIPKQFQDAVQNGALGVTDFIGNGNDDLVEAIENYRKLAEKVGDLENQVAELDATIRKLQVDKFKNIADDYEKLIGVTDNYRDRIQSVIDLEENSGNKIGVGFYDSLVSQTRERKKILEDEFNELNQNLQDALSSGKIKLGSDEWKEMYDIIVDVDSEIIQCSSDIEDFVNAKLELKVKEFEEIQEALDGINNSLSDYVDLLEDDTVTNGTTELTFTNKALTRMGLLRQQYELASEKVDLYNKRMEELRKTYNDGLLSETEYREQLMELISAQNEQAVAMKDSKDAILDLIKNEIDEVCDAIDKETEAYQKLIDKKKEALEQDKDEADFQKQVAEKQKAIFAIQRQLAALGNADDLESNARRKQLQSDLLDAKTELDELYADHNYDLQMDMLDKEAEAYEEAQEEKKDVLQKSLDDEEAIIAKYLQEVIDNHTSVYATLQELGLVYGIKLEESITEPWRIGEDAMGQYAVSLGSQTSLFISRLQGVENEIYGVQANANNMAYSLINAFGVSSAGLMNEIGNVAYALSVDYGYAQNLGNMLSSVLNSNYNTSGIVSSIYSIRDAANAAAGAIAGMLAGQANYNNNSYTSVADGAKAVVAVGNAMNVVNGASKAIAVGNAANVANGVRKTAVTGAVASIRKYAKGGLVTKEKDNPFNLIAESVGEDTMIAAKEGEMVLDKDTADSITELGKGLTRINTPSVLGNALAKIDASLLSGGLQENMPAYATYEMVANRMYYPDAALNNRPNDITVNNEVVVQGSIDNNNVARVQKQIDASINKTLRRMLGGIRYK